MKKKLNLTIISGLLLTLGIGLHLGFLNNFVDSLKQGSTIVLADIDDCAYNPDQLGCNNPGEPIGGGTLPPEQTPPAPSCDRDSSWVQKDPECDWNTHQVYEVKYNTCTSEWDRSNYHFQDGACGYTPQPQQCEHQNQGSECDWSTHQVYDFYWDTCKNDYVRYNYHSVDGQCGFSAQPQQPQPQPASNVGTCYICDGGNWRVAGGSGHQMTSDQCNQEQNSAFNQPNKPSWCGAKEEAREVPAAPAPTAAPAPAQPVQQQGQVVYAFGGNSTSLAYSYSGGSNVTINQAAPAVAPRVVTVAAPAVTKVAASKVAVEELPKTGLPLAAWTLSGFLPVGLGLRRFGSAKKSLQGSASYLWQKREFSK